MAEPLRAGARDSLLSRLQTEGALARLRADTGLDFVLRLFSSPGDRDRKTDLRQTPGDFFTRDLDDALRNGDIDLALHSAKDLPTPEAFPEDLDWFWLPWREDPRDALVVRADATPRRIGVSSARRDAWAARTFPEAERLTLRGAIPDRLAQLDRGDYDAIVVAYAALRRLGLEDRAERIIPLDELPTPPGQGVLAATFRRSDARMRTLRNLYLRAVRFVGAGVGDAELCTLAGLRELKHADCVIYDALLDPTLLDLAQGRFEAIYVGKRAGAHTLPQAEITRLIGERVRRGERVVRLKGGDPGLFGRLAEETDALGADGLAFRVWPGVSALAAATTPTGMLLTRRGVSGGFAVRTPRSEAPAANDVWFMATGEAARLAKDYPPETPCAEIRNAGAPSQTIRRATAGAFAAEAGDAPGLLLFGEAAAHAFPALGPLAGRRIWITGSTEVAEKARRVVVDFGGIPVVRPLIRFEAMGMVKIRPSKGYNLLVLTSPTAARFFLKQLASPVCFLPKRIAVTGPGTAEVLRDLHIDLIQPARDFSAEGLLAALPQDLAGWRILRVRSEEAGDALAKAFKARGATLVKDLPIYRTLPCPATEPPPHEAVFLASASAARVWLALAPRPAANTIALGLPTARALREGGVEPTVVASEQTVERALFDYARHCTTALR